MLKTSKKEREEEGDGKKDEIGAFIDAYEEDKDRIFCPKCGKRYSSSVYKCPSCGKINPNESFPIGSYYANILITTEMLLIVLAALGVERAMIYMILAPIAMLLNVIFVYLSFKVGGAVKRASNNSPKKE